MLAERKVCVHTGKEVVDVRDPPEGVAGGVGTLVCSDGTEVRSYIIQRRGRGPADGMGWGRMVALVSFFFFSSRCVCRVVSCRVSLSLSSASPLVASPSVPGLLSVVFPPLTEDRSFPRLPLCGAAKDGRRLPPPPPPSRRRPLSSPSVFVWPLPAHLPRSFSLLAGSGLKVVSFPVSRVQRPASPTPLSLVLSPADSVFGGYLVHQQRGRQVAPGDRAGLDGPGLYTGRHARTGSRGVHIFQQ